MSIKVTPTDATLGALVTDVDLANYGPSERRQIEDAFHEYGVLIFPGQDITSDAQVAFSEGFGDIEYIDEEGTHKSYPVSNATMRGTAAARTGFTMNLLRGNEYWHTDSSFMPISAKTSCLTAIQMPQSGGGTGWADMRAAYDALDDEMRDRIEELAALHSFYWSQERIGHKVETGMGYGFHTFGAPLRPLVKVHPVTGRKALYIGRHAYRIPGMADEEALALLDSLSSFACQSPRIYEHVWNPGDLAIWDNRCVMHRARPYPTDEVRILRHTRTTGDAQSEYAECLADERASAFEPVESAQSYVQMRP